MANYRNDKFNTHITLFKAFSDPNRLRIYMSLMDKELCVCQIIELLQLAPSTVSKHLLILKHAGVLKSYKKGRWIYYLISEDLTNEKKNLLRNIKESLKKDNTILRDSKRLNQILKLDRERLCRIQSGR